ncbi:MAG: hypothetical protein PHU51_02615 [Candidatus Nanoarchaeia archaeon]|nr:hypothetical protein [Candidatus Nanoarchaeia archaeon]
MVKKKLKKLQNYETSYKMSILLFLISFLMYLSGTFLGESLQAYIGKITLAIISVIILFVSYLLYLVFVSDKMLKKEVLGYVIFPIAYISSFYGHVNGIIINTSWSKWIFNIVILIIFILQVITLKKTKVKIMFKPVAIILAVMMIFLIGSLLIDDLTHEETHKLGLKLNDCVTHLRYKNSEINCEDYSNKVIVGHNVSCKLKQINLTNISGYVEFTNVANVKNNQTFETTIDFLIPSENKMIFIEIDGLDNNKSVCLSSSYNVRFATYEEYKENKQNFTTFLGGLIGFILLSVPLIITNWGKLFSFKKTPKRKQKKNILKKSAKKKVEKKKTTKTKVVKKLK